MTELEELLDRLQAAGRHVAEQVREALQSGVHAEPWVITGITSSIHNSYQGTLNLCNAIVEGLADDPGDIAREFVQLFGAKAERVEQERDELIADVERLLQGGMI